MAGPPWLVLALFADVDGVAADTSENTFAFNAGTINDAINAVNDFYVNPAGQVHAISDYLGSSVSRVAGQAVLQGYDISGHLDGSPHGSPVLSAAFVGLDPGVAGADLPRQSALTLAYHGAGIGTVLEHGPPATRPTDEEAQDEGAPATHLAKTRPKGSHRGRIQIGPLDTRAIGPDGNIAPNCLSDLKIAAHRLVIGTGVGVTTNPGWSVWSRVLASLDLINGGWVDNELGVIRRRKNKTAIHSAWV